MNEELDASQEERAVEGVRADMAVFARPEEKEESYPGQVSNIFLALCTSLKGRDKGLED